MQQQSEHQEQYNDEIDLFEIIEIIWKGKWVIVSSTCVALLIGMLYLNQVPIKYSVKIPYSVNLHSIEVQQRCGGNVNCSNEQTTASILNLVGGLSAWTSANSEWSTVLTDKKSVALIHGQLLEASIRFNTQLRQEAREEEGLIANQLKPQLLSTERVATNYLNAKRLLARINNGINAVEIMEPKVVLKAPKISLVAALSLILGGMLGVFLVFIRRGLESYKQRSSRH
ncbi:MAG: Wzz/FepE/Etk N-terminal domain-containing protein [Gammaproteobacteria bacterium]|nr:Wzz/FepE/Etk N-terminal domain-containing protein [Gammaproteobacteria bacterium]